MRVSLVPIYKYVMPHADGVSFFTRRKEKGKKKLADSVHAAVVMDGRRLKEEIRKINIEIHRV